MTLRNRDVGLALSGGGFRAAAFHLGCLRALDDTGVLQRVRVVSGASGGALLGALWAYGSPDFRTFDRQATELMVSGLQLLIAKSAMHPTRVARNVLSSGVAAAATALRFATRRPVRRGEVHVQRSATLTDALVDVLRRGPFRDCQLGVTTHPGIATVLASLDLISGNAMRFGNEVSGCSAYGTLVDEVDVATAVAASAAYPIFFPALERRYHFRSTDGHVAEWPVILTDGGVYDNLATSVYAPGRDPAHSPHVYPDVRYLVVCDAGQGRRPATEAHFWPGRQRQVADVLHRRGQDLSRSLLFLWKQVRHIDGFVHAYLGMRDSRLPEAIPDLVRRDLCWDYPTDFAHMSRADLDRLATRGEQLTRVLLRNHCPSLLA